MKSKRRITRRVGLASAALLVAATPAFASMLTENFMEAEIDSIDACFSKVGGADVGAHGKAVVGFVGDATQFRDVDGSVNDAAVDEANEVKLLQEDVTVTGMIGDRVTYTDVVRYQNTCDEDILISLNLTETDGDWADRTAKVYLSQNAATAPELDVADPVAVADADIVTDAAHWDQAPLHVDPDGVITNARTTEVLLPTGQELRGAFVVATGVDASTTDSAILRWTAAARRATTPTPSPGL